MYYLLLEGRRDRDRFIADLAADGVNAVFHYVPLHSLACGPTIRASHGSLEVTDSVSERLVRLPLWVGMTSDDTDRVVKAVGKALD